MDQSTEKYFLHGGGRGESLPSQSFNVTIIGGRCAPPRTTCINMMCNSLLQGQE